MEQPRRKMSRYMTNTEEDDITDVHDPIINIYNPLVEVSVPKGEPTIFQALRINDIDMVQLQLRQGVDINIKHESVEQYRIKCPSMAHRIQTNNYAPLHIAVLHSSRDLLECLMGNGADVDTRDKQGRAPLHIAVVAQRISVLRLLIIKGADINLQSSSGRTPILEAAIHESFDCVDVLLEAGANLDLVDTKGASVLHQLCFHRVPKFNQIEKIIKGGCNMNIENTKGATPLMFAVGMQDLKLVKLLLDNGTDMNQADAARNSAIHFVFWQQVTPRKLGLLLFLIHLGSSIDCVDRNGDTLLIKAIKSRAVSAIRLLLLSDCQRDAKTIMDSPDIVELCDDLPDFKEWLQKELHTPRPLTRICRENIRTCFGNRLSNISDTELPKMLEDFVLVKDIQHPPQVYLNKQI